MQCRRMFRACRSNCIEDRGFVTAGGDKDCADAALQAPHVYSYSKHARPEARRRQGELWQRQVRQGGLQKLHTSYGFGARLDRICKEVLG